MSAHPSEQYSRRVNIITIGQIDHGKTTLTAALVKSCAKIAGGRLVSIDEVPGVKDSDFGANVAYAEYSSKTQRYRHADGASHVNVIRNILCGPCPIDGAILVVSALDGVGPQSREHVALCHEADVPRIVVFLNKAEAVDDPENLDFAVLEVRELLSQHGYSGADAPVVVGSALAGLQGGDREGLGTTAINSLLDSIDSWIVESQCKQLRPECSSHAAFTAEVFTLTKDEGGLPLSEGHSLKFRFGGTVTTGVCRLPQGVTMLPPGDNLRLEIALTEAVAMVRHSRFTVREGNRVVGGGMVAKIIE